MSNYKHIDVDTLRRDCAGIWDQIFEALLPEFDRALYERPGRKAGPCPVCGGGHDRFTFFKDVAETGGAYCRRCDRPSKSDGFQLIKEARGMNFAEVIREVNQVVHGEGAAKPLSPYEKQLLAKRKRELAEQEREKNEKRREKLRQVWCESFTADAPEADLVRRYLVNRGLPIETLPQTLRFHPGLKSFDQDGNYEGTFPCMLALVVDRNGDPVTIHRTFLTEQGQKAPVESAKKLMPYPTDRDASGGAIHLSGTGPVLNVAEGIETAFAVQAMVGGSIWATVNASMMRNLEIGEPVEAVWVWADLDRSGDGQKSGRELVERQRKQGLQATCMVPPVSVPAGDKAVDWLDVYNHWWESIAQEKAQFVRRSQKRVA